MLLATLADAAEDLQTQRYPFPEGRMGDLVTAYASAAAEATEQAERLRTAWESAPAEPTADHVAQWGERAAAVATADWEAVHVSPADRRALEDIEYRLLFRIGPAVAAALAGHTQP